MLDVDFRSVVMAMNVRGVGKLTVESAVKIIAKIVHQGRAGRQFSREPNDLLGD